MELRQLRYFCKACELGTVTAAANELYVTEQTISYALKKLEQELGQSLLIRSKTGVIPTQAGLDVFEKAQAIVLAADNLLASMRPVTCERKTVRFFITTMGIPEGKNFSIDVLDAFATQHPNIEVNISEAPTQKCIRAVLGGHADLALTYSWPQEPELEPHLLMNGEIAFAMSTNHPLAQKEEISFADLRDVPVLWAMDTGYAFAVLDERCKAYGFEPTLHSVPSSSYLDAAATGKGVAMALATHPKLVTKAGLTSRRLIAKDHFTVPICLVIPADTPKDSPTRTLLNWLLKAWHNKD